MFLSFFFEVPGEHLVPSQTAFSWLISVLFANFLFLVLGFFLRCVSFSLERSRNDRVPPAPTLPARHGVPFSPFSTTQPPPLGRPGSMSFPLPPRTHLQSNRMGPNLPSIKSGASFILRPFPNPPIMMGRQSPETLSMCNGGLAFPPNPQQTSPPASFSNNTWAPPGSPKNWRTLSLSLTNPSQSYLWPLPLLFLPSFCSAIFPICDLRLVFPFPSGRFHLNLGIVELILFFS